MRTKQSITEEVKVTEKESFTLQLPAELDVKPDWTVDLPRGHKAEVYAAPVPQSDWGHGDNVDGWKIFILDEAGRYIGDRRNCTSLAQVKREVSMIADALRRKKTRRSRIEEYED